MSYDSYVTTVRNGGPTEAASAANSLTQVCLCFLVFFYSPFSLSLPVSLCLCVSSLFLLYFDDICLVRCVWCVVLV